MASSFSPSIEDYLETIYELGPNTGVRLVDVSGKMSVTKPSVNRAVSVLVKSGLVTQEKYGLIYLTKEGIKKASEIRGRHEILSRFLQDILKVPGQTAEEEACKIEHVLSQETADKLLKFMENYKG